MKLSLLRQKDFSLLICGEFASLFGTLIQSFALSLYVLDMTGSAKSFASVMAITILPRLILGPIAGVFADWFDRKKIIVYLDFLSSIVVGSFAFIYFIYGELSLIHVYILSVLLALISTFFNPASSTIIPSIVKKEELVEANTISSFVMRIPNFLSMVVGGFLYGLFGLFPILLVNSLSFLLSAVSEMFINVPKNNNKPEKISFASFKKDFGEGLRLILNNSSMLTMIIIALILNSMLSPIFGIGVPFVSREILSITAEKYGLMQSISVIGMFLSPIIASKCCKNLKVGHIVVGTMLINSLLVAAMSIIPTSFFLNMFEGQLVPIITMTIISFTSTLLIGITNIALTIQFQNIIPLSMMGRVGSVMGTVCVAAVPIGQMVFGFMFDKIEAWLCIFIGASILFITILLFAKNLCRENNTDTMQETPIQGDVNN